MPLVRISLMEGKSADYRRKIGDVVHQAMVDTINCPPRDRFQLISEHSKGDFFYAPVYLDIPHTDDLVMIQITLNEGRRLISRRRCTRRSPRVCRRRSASNRRMFSSAWSMSGRKTGRSERRGPVRRLGKL
jgi:phenylpyruvate tautomerase PptA (4-oxalocrotonate tautomerase family)